MRPGLVALTLAALLVLALAPNTSIPNTLGLLDLSTASAADLAQASCTNAMASFSPSVLGVPGTTVLTATGFQPNTTVTITGGSRPSGGVFRPETTTLTPGSSCTVTYTLTMDFDSAPGPWTMHVTGTRFNAQTPLNLMATFTVVVPTPTPFPTPTYTPQPLFSPAPTCPIPSVTLTSARVTQGQNLNVIARGFRPGTFVDVLIEGQSGTRVTDVVGPASGTCEIVDNILISEALFPAGRYVLTLITATSSGTLPTTTFEVLARTGSPTATTVVAPPPTATTVPVPPTATIPGVPPPPPPTATTVPVQPPPTGPRPAPLAVQQQLTLTGGAQVPTVGETSIYDHVIRITNTGTGAPQVSFDGPRGLLFASALNLSLQGETLTLNLSTEYSGDTQVASATSNVGQPQVRGNVLTWDGQLQVGESLELRSNLQHTPSSALTLNQPIRGQVLAVSDPRGTVLTAPAPTPPPLPPSQRLVQPPPPPVDPITGSRMFPETGFAVGDDNIWAYFIRRGGQKTFGAPVSRLMLLNGAWVQLFERSMLQAFEDGRVVSVNLLEPPYLPYESFGDLTLPPADEGLIFAAPDPAAPDFAARAQEFVRANAAEQYENLATRYYTTFMGTVLFRDAFFDGRGDPNLVPGFNLEIWGLPTSYPAYQTTGADEIDPAVALQRFQRGVMMHDARTGQTSGVQLGYYLRSILAGEDAIPALADVAGTSPLWAQYNPDALDWVDRADELPDTNLVLAFTRDDGAGEAVTIGARTQALWVVVNAPTVVFSEANDPLWIARPGEIYRVRRQDGAWALVAAEGDPDRSGWLPLDGRVEFAEP